MENEFLPYELALRMKQLGFDEPCFGRYYYKESYPMLNPNSGETELVFEFGQYIKQTEITILAPLFQQAFRWFREKGYLISFSSHDDRIHDFYIKWQLSKSILSDTYDTPEEAELACLEKLIEIVEKQNLQE